MANETTKAVGTLEKKPFYSFLTASTLFGFCGTLIQATVSTYFANYMTDTVLIPAGTASIIMLIACLWDAINDPMMGAIAERGNSRWGKYRPYILTGGPLLTLVTFFLFFDISGLSDNARVWYIAIVYILYGMVITFYSIPTGSVTASYIGDMKQRNKVYMFGGIAAGVAFTIASTWSETISGWFGGESWCWNMLLYGIPMIFFGIWYFKSSKERFIVKKDKMPVFKSLKMVLRHKAIWVCIVIWIMASVGYGLMFTSSVYYIKYCVATSFEQWALIGTYMLVLSVGALVSMVVFQPLFLKMFKFDHNKAMMLSQGLTVIFYAILFFVGRQNFVVLCVLSFLATCATAMQQSLVSAYIAEAIDFVQLKEGTTMGALINSVKGFAYKLGTTGVNYGILALLAVTGYVENAVGVEMGQSAAAIEAINILRFGIPTICAVIMVLACIFYPIRKHRGEINEMKAKMAQELNID